MRLTSLTYGRSGAPTTGMRAGASQVAYKMRAARSVLEHVGMAPGRLKVLPAGDNLPAAGAIDHEHGSVAVECLRGLLIPASERRLRLAPLLARVRLELGAFTGSVRGKIPVACGKSAAGMSAPPLQRWHARQ